MVLMYLIVFAWGVQSKDYDDGGDYVRTWCPELKNVPASKVHQPWQMSREEMVCSFQYLNLAAVFVT